MYNIVFTSVPIVWFAVMDTQFIKNDLLTNTKYYRIGLKDQCFGTAVFWRWFTLGAFKALILMYVCLYAMDISMRPDGHMLGLWPEGAIVYAGVVLIANHKLFLEFNYVSYHGPTLLIISVLLYFAFVAFESIPAINFESTLGIFDPIFTSPLTYFALFFVVVVNYVLDRIIWYLLTIAEERELE
jgi:phospholipid-translocating ATPase